MEFLGGPEKKSIGWTQCFSHQNLICESLPSIPRALRPLKIPSSSSQHQLGIYSLLGMLWVQFSSAQFCKLGITQLLVFASSTGCTPCTFYVRMEWAQDHLHTPCIWDTQYFHPVGCPQQPLQRMLWWGLSVLEQQNWHLSPGTFLQACSSLHTVVNRLDCIC